MAENSMLVWLEAATALTPDNSATRRLHFLEPRAAAPLVPDTEQGPEGLGPPEGMREGWLEGWGGKDRPPVGTGPEGPFTRYGKAGPLDNPAREGMAGMRQLSEPGGLERVRAAFRRPAW